VESEDNLLVVTAGRFLFGANKGGMTMNTQGWIRGMMAKNMEAEKFLHHVTECLGREFEADSQAQKFEAEYIIKLGEHECSISMEKATELQQKSPYALDRYLLDQFRGQGFDFEVTRSQYIRYCYGVFEKRFN